MRRTAIPGIFCLAFLTGIYVWQDTAASPIATTIDSDIVADTVWTSAGSPYMVTGFVDVVAGVTLTIEAGVEVIVQSSARLRIVGELDAVGTPTQPITFTGPTSQPGSWRGLYAVGDPSHRARITLEHAILEYGGNMSINAANLTMAWTDATIRHSIFRNSAQHGLYSDDGSRVELFENTFIHNTATAMVIEEMEQDPRLEKLAATGNGSDAIAVYGYQEIGRDGYIWEHPGLPYVIEDGIWVLKNGVLTIDPGVELRFASGADLRIWGQINAIGAATQPITLTGSTPTPGIWDGLVVFDQAMATIEYAVVEYGGGDNTKGNVVAEGAHVNVRHTIIRHGAAAGLYFADGAEGSWVEASQIVGNAGYALFNANSAPTDPPLVATSNWWGAASGPQAPGGCNPGGLGGQVSANVAFRPFLTSPTEQPDLVPVNEAAFLSLTPERWFAPADGLSPVWFTITLRDGTGQPLPGRIIRLQSTLGAAEDGGITDQLGRTRARLSSTVAGEADVRANLENRGSCELLRGALTTVTFTPPVAATSLTDDAAPYLSNGIEITPMPITRGAATSLRGTLINPNPYPIVVDVEFGYAQAGIGLAFGPVGAVNDTHIPANGSATVEVLWTPPVSGHYCVQMTYTAHPAAKVNAALIPQGVHAEPQRAQRNLSVMPAPWMGKPSKDALQRAKFASDALDDADFALGALDDASGVPGALIQDQLFGNILDFIFEGGGVSDCAMNGGAECGGWKGPRLKLPGETIGNLREDPPSPNYQSIVITETIPFTPLLPGPDLPAARADALNALMTAALRLESTLFAAAVSHDRYAGAAEAEDLAWTSAQAAAYLTYLYASGAALIDTADGMDALVQALRNEGVVSVVVTPQAYQNYQQRLATSGFSAVEIDAAHLVGFDDAAIDRIRQRRLAADPNEAGGDLLEKLTQLAAAYRAAGLALLSPPGYGIHSSAGSLSAASDAEPIAHLAQVYQATATVQVANPLTHTTDIVLRARALDLPIEWQATITPTIVTLAPGEQITASVTLAPGAAVPQGIQPRVAVEGYVGARLLGGVVVQITVPQREVAEPRIYLPQVRRP